MAAKEAARRIALVAVQDSPVAFDLASSLAKLARLTEQARQTALAQVTPADGAVDVVVVFPEAFLSCYPRGYDVSAVKLGCSNPLLTCKPPPPPVWRKGRLADG